jgi:ATP-dependent DNA helicase RecG
MSVVGPILMGVTGSPKPNLPGGAAWLWERRLDREFGKAKAKPFVALGLETVEDLLRHFPRRYEEAGAVTFLADLTVGEHITVLARVESSSMHVSRKSGKFLINAVIGDGVGSSLDVTLFYRDAHRAQWGLKRLRPGAHGLFTGTVGEYRGRAQLTHPAMLMVKDPGEGAERVLYEAELPIPIYPASASLPSWKLHAAITGLLERFPLDDLPDPLPRHLRAEEKLMPLGEALRRIHRPQAMGQWEGAQRRFRFEEAFTTQVALARLRAATAAQHATPRPVLSPALAPRSLLAAFDERLPFRLTDAQVRVGQVVAAHLSHSSPMQRLLQGDVGSGKTVVALRAMLQVVDAGGQAVLLAPTEVLAHQHFQTLREMLGPLAREGSVSESLEGGLRRVEVRLLTGSLGAAQRRETLADLASGRADLVIGTHALLSDPVDFADLGLVVVDEQHRFGVEQRDVLRRRGAKPPHVLVMTATPIPRSIAMTVFGDLEIVTLDELPGGRPDVLTHVVPASRSTWVDRVWQRVAEEAGAGHGVFVVVPRIDAVEAPEGQTLNGPPGRGPLATVEDTMARFASNPTLSALRCAAIHGRVPAEEKDRIMREFASGEIQVLVATTVIEVGIDVPRATLMVVLDADRFGLAQLHQLRGRIGRGSEPGTCLLVSGAPPDSAAAKRLAAMARCHDGFALSEVDLELRREGDVLGTDQSGLARSLRFLRVLRDRDLILGTRVLATDLVARDPELARYPELASYVARRFAGHESFMGAV